MGYQLRSHTADIAVEATGGTLGEVFGATADGMAAAMCEEWPGSGEHVDITVAAEGREALLFDYLDELIYERDVHNVLPVDNTGTVVRDDGADRAVRWRFTGKYRGVPLEQIDAREVKAVTYSEMELVETADGWRAYVVFDM